MGELTRTRVGKFWLWAGLTVLALTLALSLNVRQSYAGSVDIKDDANVLSASDKSELQSRGSSLPFNVRLFTSATIGSADQLASQVQSYSSSLGSGLVIGVGTKIGSTKIKGQNISVNDGEATQIAQTANNSFKQGNWRAGFDAMLDQARQLGTAPISSGSNSGVRPVNPVPATRSSGGGFPVWGCLIIGLIALVAFSVFGFGRRRSVNNNYNNGNVGPGYGGNVGPGYGGNVGPGYGGGYGPGYNQGGYGPGYNQGGGGMGALGGGAIGAGLGGLVGYELGKNEGRNQAGYGNNAGNVGGGYVDNGSGFSSNDSGTGGSDWGANSGGNSGGSDWGSSSSSGSFDAGGGGDWGGGGGDSGGGGGGGDSGGSSW